MELQTQLQPHISSSHGLSTGRHVVIDGETYYRISNSQTLPPFFISLVSGSNHWVFLASNGAVTMGRRNPKNALFPYYCADKLVDMAHTTGPRTLLRVCSSHGEILWEPFSDSASDPNVTVNLYKSLNGSKLQFEATHHGLGVAFRYAWETSDRFGFVRTSHLTNLSEEPLSIGILDGLQNILPYGIDESIQLRFSNLVDAYKKSELLSPAGLGIYYLSSIPTDHAEPSEGLRATVVWQSGLTSPTILLSGDQIAAFCHAAEVRGERDIRAKRGAYLVHANVELEPQENRTWSIIADLEHDQTDVVALSRFITSENPLREVRQDIRQGQEKLNRLIAEADGYQHGDNLLRTHRHQSNVIFNLMRGGTPLDGYQICVIDFCEHLRQCNRPLFQLHRERFSQLADAHLSRTELIHLARSTEDWDLIRIALEYLPLTLSRRHGDPTRPWNTFSIETKNQDGSPKINYEGNWRDIFQNWEALGFSYPRLLNGMILRFVNASTADGYNPFRLTKTGFDWELLDSNDPWSNIGYWGDHQIAYLQKLLEWAHRFDPRSLSELLHQRLGVYASVPYRIRGYDDIRRDPHQTIDYDYDWAAKIAAEFDQTGSDGRLHKNQLGQRHQVTIFEKLLLTALIKITNFVPDVGIWLNTQRPEWNDANNALVGNGASVVTVCYLRRYLNFLASIVKQAEGETYPLTREIGTLLEQITTALASHEHWLDRRFTDESRRQIVDQLQAAGAAYRERIYNHGFQGDFSSVSRSQVLQLIEQSLHYLDRTIESNQRPDGLYHAYNLLRFEDASAEPDNGTPYAGRLCFEHLYEMLEGQVAVLNSQKLSPEEVVDLLTALRNSAMYRDDLQTYLLYPDRDLPEFLHKNLILSAKVDDSALVQHLLATNSSQIIRRDENGDLRFNGSFRNAEDLKRELFKLKESQPELGDWIDREQVELQELFRSTFQHHRFTGRSATFFGYEGLGCVYWHMVSKLILAVADSFSLANHEGTARETIEQLKTQYREIRDGLGLNCLPSKYGAFPIDPYSHTPRHAGAQQPGMTGQVKEDILSRFVELGVCVNEGVLSFRPGLFERSELLKVPGKFPAINLRGEMEWLSLPAGSFAFTFCQVPVIYRYDNTCRLKIFHANSAEPVEVAGHALTLAQSQSLFGREGKITCIECYF